MSVVTLNSVSSSRISQNLVDASLYMNGQEGTFDLKPVGSNQSQNLSSSTPHEAFLVGRKKSEEIDVFTADKYFNEEANCIPKSKELPSQQHKKNDPLQILDIKERTRVPTRSIRSESTWNSRSSLLHTAPRNQQPCRRGNKKSFLASFGCNCSCNDKDSVEIDDYTGGSDFSKIINSRLDNGEAKQEPENHAMVPRKEELQCKELNDIRDKLKVDDHFSFPVFNLTTTNPAVKVELQEKDDSSTRKSLQVFGSPIPENEKNSLILERRLAMLNWDTISPRMEEIKVPASSKGMCKDSDSDTSSDLFELESFSTSANPFLTRQASDANSTSSCITPTTCYAPSEASIEWSVITASAADFSTTSDTEDLRTTTTATIKTVVSPPKWRRPSILSGCKSHTSVRVAGDLFPNSRRHHQPESFTPETKFRTDSKLMGFDKGNSQNSFHSRALSRSPSGRETNLLYIH